MIPKRLSLSGFLSYREPVEVDFSSLEVACISGANGAGKSSLLDAITFALFGQARKRDDSLINSQSETAEVVYVFEYEGNNYRVQRAKPRDKTTLLEFHIQNAEGDWKALTERTLRDTDALIQKTLRLDYETFVNASFFLQGKADQFTQQRPADRKRILSSILGLEIWESYRLAASARKKSVEDEISSLDGRLQEISTELNEEDARKVRLKELSDQLEQISKTRKAQETVVDEIRLRAASVKQQNELVATLATQLSKAQGQIEELRTRLVERQEEQAQHLSLIGRANEIDKSHKIWMEKRAGIGQLDELAGRFRAEEKRRAAPLTAIESEKVRLETELRGLLAESTKSNENATLEAKLTKDLKAVQADISKIEKQTSEGAKQTAELEEAKAKQISLQAENPHLKAEMDELVGRIKQIEKAKGASCPTCGQELTEDHRKEMVTLWTADGKEKGDRYRSNKKSMGDADNQVALLENSVAGLKQVEERLREQTRAADQIGNRLEELQRMQSEWQKEREPRVREVEKILKSEEYAVDARVELSKIDRELKEIGYDAAKHDLLRKEEEELRSAETEMRQLEQAQAAFKPLEREVSELEKQIGKQEEAIGESEKAHIQAVAGLAASEVELPNVQASEGQLREVQESENQLRQEVGAAKQRVAVLEDLRKRKSEIEGQREGLAASVGEFQSLERAFGKDGVPAMLIEQALPQIEVRANEVLERLSGGQMHINFVTQQAYKDAKRDDLRETLEIQISDSAGERDYEMFSGGEAFRINFAIRLALSEVLAQRAGARLQTLVIDEGFGSQDESGRQRLVEAINLVKDDFAKILVITHIDSLKDAFPTRIEVTKSSMGSTVTVN